MSGRQEERGFVLPYVLVVIAILSIAGTIAAQRLTRASAVVSDMRMKAQSQQLLQSAEAAVTYSLLTSNPQRGGYDLSPASPIVWEFGILNAQTRKPMTASEVESFPSDFWPANGGLRRYSFNPSGDSNRRSTAASGPVLGTAAMVRLQDASGLVSLSQGNDAMLRSVFVAVGADKQRLPKLMDALHDYTDTDDYRRASGAEISDYIREGRIAPSNSPLRSHTELAAIYGWESELERMDLNRLKELTTIAGTPGFRQEFARRSHIGSLGIRGDSLLSSRRAGLNEILERANASTSGYSRITLHAPRADGRYDKRVIEIDRVSGLGAPYRRRWVYDSTVLESDFEKTPDVPMGEAGLNLDGLKDVVHTAPTAR